ncbi:MAG TPA: twin-arginine translocase subunit TatC [Solirubrobacteraceae bacterium]|jgi:sec-independent protein translocase protein TatC
MATSERAGLAAAIGRAGHGQRLSFVSHLEELRARLIVSLAVLGVAFGFCMWQNHALLKIVNAPLAGQTQKQVEAGHGPLGATYEVQLRAREIASEVATGLGALERQGSGASAATRTTLSGVTRKLRSEAKSLSGKPTGEKPVTLGIGEPFATTVGVSLLFAFVLSLPLILYELYAFLVPALEPTQRRFARPLLLAVPIMFSAGAAFGYFVVLPHAIRFLANFNSDQFNTLVQASTYYHFVAITLLAMGIVFQVPIGILLLTRSGVVSARTLRRGRRYAIAACAAIAALLPGDAITLVLETVPLYLLFELSVLIAGAIERVEARRARSAGDTA